MQVYIKLCRSVGERSVGKLRIIAQCQKMQCSADSARIMNAPLYTILFTIRFHFILGPHV